MQFPAIPCNFRLNYEKIRAFGNMGISTRKHSSASVPFSPSNIPSVLFSHFPVHSDSMAMKRDSIRQFLKRDSTTVSTVPSDFTLASLREALETLPALRTDCHLKTLRAFTGPLAIFAELTETIHTACCRAMKYEYCGKGTVRTR